MAERKTMTVTYGDFCCTLEGFDDPLAALRTVVEYFLDLGEDEAGTLGTTPRRLVAEPREGGILLKPADPGPGPVKPPLRLDPDIMRAPGQEVPGPLVLSAPTPRPEEASTPETAPPDEADVADVAVPSFAAFCRRHDIHGLTGHIEAAAAHAALLGRGPLSRDGLLGKAAQGDVRPFRRDEGLGCIEALIAEGRLSEASGLVRPGPASPMAPEN